jgi:hypothetical protein
VKLAAVLLFLRTQRAITPFYVFARHLAGDQPFLALVCITPVSSSGSRQPAQRCRNPGCRLHVPGDFSGGKRSWHREESQNVAHNVIALTGLKKELSVRGAIHNGQLLRLGSFLNYARMPGSVGSRRGRHRGRR